MTLIERAARHAALGDPVRLAMVDDLCCSDRSPGELAERHGLAGNLLAHHLKVLEDAGLIERVVSAGDRRRRYVRLRSGSLEGLMVAGEVPSGPVLFLCTHNSARSQMAAAIWAEQIGGSTGSAGTHPARRVHPGAVRAAARAGLDLTGARPRSMEDIVVEPELVVTVCDRAHEELAPEASWWHWSIPDPLEESRPGAFDRALAEIQDRIRTVTEERKR